MSVTGLNGVGGSPDTLQVAARADGGPGGSRHLVQFYDADAFLAGAASRFIGAGLGSGDAAVLIATPPHVAQIEARLGATGLDLSTARRDGRYVVLDAADTLAHLMSGESPDERRFAEVVGGVVAGAAGPKRLPVRVFGEMVALLWAEGRRRAALRLEALWNDLARIVPFSLLCAYPMRGFPRAADAASLAEVCGEHARVLPAESYAELSTADERLRSIARLQQKAAALEAEIAERAALETRLVSSLAREREARAEAESLARGKDDFLATLSHELRTPLTAMLGWVRVLRAGELDADGTAYGLAVLERNARAQARLIEDLLDVSGIVAGQLQLQVRDVDLAELIQGAMQAMSPAADGKGVRLEARLDTRIGPVSGDPDRLQQVVSNLLSNAVKYTPAGGRVDVELTRVGPVVTIAVADTGIGISAEFLPRLFERFTQAGGRVSGSRGGLGLGLAIVRHLVALHGGAVEARSDGEGLGSIFTVTLPIRERAGA